MTEGERLMRSGDFMWTKRSKAYKIDVVRRHIGMLSRFMEAGMGKFRLWYSGNLPIREIAITRDYLAELEKPKLTWKLGEESMTHKRKEQT